jgi:hypothetical protein
MPPAGRYLRRPYEVRFSRHPALAILPHFILREDTKLLRNEPHVVIATPCYSGQLTMAYVDLVLELQAACIARAIRIDFDLPVKNGVKNGEREQNASASLLTYDRNAA